MPLFDWCLKSTLTKVSRSPGRGARSWILLCSQYCDERTDMNLTGLKECMRIWQISRRCLSRELAKTERLQLRKLLPEGG